ncbi:MAG: ParB/RepB/Spo0J family partition protein, partial [Bdellovibrionales bacterium]|nr:ParB/RepB/Spo0J family partition protein [Bdellovibrionales bacterium]
KYLSVDQIIPNRYQPRKTFDESEISDLAASVKEHGVLQPVIVRRTGDGAFELIAGERRLRAAKIAGLAAIPALVRLSNDEKSLALALVENVQRQNLNPMEEARAYTHLIDDFGLSQEQVSTAVGKDRSTVANLIRLLSLPREIQDFIEHRQISLGHAKVLLGLKQAEKQVSIARQIIRDSLSVRAAEIIVNKAKNNNIPRTVMRKSNEFFHVEEQVRRRLGSKVHIAKSRKGGKLIIHFFSEEELERIVGSILE